ncbi:MAG TPA: hypothetical protein VLA53_00645 [Nitrosopumilaceae archaeon]|nr:hypothetical protein [Nitrosopumilaceae archaeon]
MTNCETFVACVEQSLVLLGIIQRKNGLSKDRFAELAGIHKKQKMINDASF